MAVLAEAFSAIVRHDAIERKYPGGWAAFGASVPNGTLCSDGEIARVGFMDPRDLGRFIEHLERAGLTYLADNAAKDIALVDQQRGLMTACDWLEFGKLPVGEGRSVSACWLFEEPRMGAGMHVTGTRMTLATPRGWTFEGSLSHDFTFTPGDPAKGGRLTFLRSENGFDVYRDERTGKEVRTARTD